MQSSSRVTMLAVAMGLWAATTLTLWGCADNEPRQSLNIEKTGTVALTATVEEVDLESRMVTLRTPAGRAFRLHAGQEVVNLPQVRPGDEVVAVYSEAVAVRMARPGEVRDDFIQEMGRAKPGSEPGAYEIAETTITARIEEMDKTRQTVVLRLPDNELLPVKAMDPANLEKVRVGDTIVITYREALAVSLEKQKK